MNKITALLCALLVVVSTVTGCSGNGAAAVTFNQLFADHAAYADRQITVEGYYFHGFETIVLSERLELSGLAPGHLTPRGRMVWVSGGIPNEDYNRLNQQQIMGPTERFGRVRITGKFEYGGKYGHLGSFDRQITPQETTLLPWQPPVSGTTGEGFAIYLTRTDIPPAQMPVISHFDLAEKPVIGMDDIISYNAQTHEMKLTPGAFERIAQLEVPVRGKSFVVCVDKATVYWGAFWTPISSISFDGVTIWKPLGKPSLPIITLELGYPSVSFYGGTDPRNSPEIIRSLQQAGKLISALTLTAIDKLPHAVKGYELYSWEEDGQWRFTLITGTNRNKTVAEITSKEDFISEAGWVKIGVGGVDGLKTVLSKLPQGENVFWLGGMRSEPGTPAGIKITLPAESIVTAVKEYAVGCGVELMVGT